MRFSEEVLIARKKLGLTQVQLANILKIGKATVIRWENDQTEPHQVMKEHFYLFCENNNIKFEK